MIKRLARSLNLLVPAAWLLIPFLLYPSLLAVLARIRPLRPRVEPGFSPRVALVIPAFNEESVIGAKLENCLALDYPKTQLRIVVVSESTDRTNDIVLGYAARGVELRRFPRVGKGAMLAQTVPTLTDPVVAFSDADIDLPPSALTELVLPLSDPRIGCVVGNLQTRRQGSSSGAFGQSLYWRLEVFLKRAASRRFAVLGATGAFYAVRRECYRSLTAARSDDFEIGVNVRLQGGGVVFVDSASCFETSSHTLKTQFARRARIVSWYGRSAMLLLAASIAHHRYALAAQIVCHKMLRWSSPVAAVWLMAGLSTAASLWFLLIPAAAVGATALAVVADGTKRTLPRPVMLIAYVSTSGAGSVVGLWRALTPRERNVWDPQSQRE